VGLSFVVQEHAARRLHYDFRLELDGVLLSWAVPKGPSCRAGEKRLAVQTEDHPLEYGGFEGVIPEGEYGAGSVLVWDRGTWEPVEDPHRGLEKGHLRFVLHGQKLAGAWDLVRIRGQRRGDEQRTWLLLKRRDDEACAPEDDEPVERRPDSVVSGRSLAAVAQAKDRVWHSQPSAAPTMATPPSRPAPSLGELVAALIKRLRMTNPDRVLYPEENLTKRDLALYYVQIADRMFPFVRDRVLTLVRCPEGRDKPCFYQKHPKADLVGVVPVPVDEIDERGQHVQYMAISSAEGIVSLVQMGVLEVHVWGCRRDRVDRPDQLVFDLDPAPDVAWGDVVAAALEVRTLLGQLGLQSFARTTGGKGVHLVVPISRHCGWSEAKTFSNAVAAYLASTHPDRYVANMAKRHRSGRIFVDYLRNQYGASAIAPYSTRSKPGAPVAAPVSWDELAVGNVQPTDFHVANVQDWSSRPDPWSGYFDIKQDLPRSSP
jgi:bifunctional non-homologous end joining protein LigD